MVDDLEVSGDSWLRAAIRFQPSRQPFCDMQEGVRLAAERAARLLFPDTRERPSIPWSPASHWRPEDDKLNIKQKEAINAMTAAVAHPLPPVLVLGPYGTGKTFTMAHGIKHILTNQPEARILVCTHSNSAADLYIREYLSGYLEAGLEAARPLRVYYRHRWLGTVHASVRQFALLEENPDDPDVTFRRPSVEDVLKHRVVVATLSITKYLTCLNLPEGTFTHLLVDEAAQALEWEVARVLSLAGPHTRLVLAGDHLQLSPDVYSEVCQERQYQRSLLERLQALYGSDFPCCITLHENYRSHADIVQLTSELFYGRRLRSSGHPGRHPSLPPVTFFSARGTARQSSGTTGYCNDAEVYEVADRVAALLDAWPAEWGERADDTICVVSAYAEQVQKIRSELRSRRLSTVTVEHLLNVQGKEFRAVFVSTVRTRDSCADTAGDYRFLTDCKLLNTAITRARSLLAVVGCPVDALFCRRVRQVLGGAGGGGGRRRRPVRYHDGRAACSAGCRRATQPARPEPAGAHLPAAAAAAAAAGAAAAGGAGPVVLAASLSRGYVVHQVPSQRGGLSLPLYLRGAAPPPPPPDAHSYAAAVRRSLEPLPPGLAALPRREHYAHGYSHF
ncbi:probable helicase with zinc finger domain [Pollicipes pollicipes]|uniref:probable helicase with zinc finger domain n=1 Tax=Pollicipes pollicipes TaxID=41117 RepID=UPI0018849267|nr:probable helicase with zinc finger domain [Pollicipes pollicipes]